MGKTDPLVAVKVTEESRNGGAAEELSETMRPLSTAQLGIWTSLLDDPGRNLNIGEYYAIEGAFDPHLFTQACCQLVAEFGLYRLVFADTPDGPRQHVRNAITWLPVIRDLRSEPEPEVAAKNWMQADFGEAVEVTSEPLFTVALLQIADDHCLLYQRCHGLICDEPGFAMTMARLATLYTGLAADAQTCRASGTVTRLAATSPPIRRSVELRQELIEDLRVIAAQRGANLADFLSIAVAIYLHRLGGAQAADNVGPIGDVHTVDDALTWAGRQCSLRVDDLALILYDPGAGHPPLLELEGNPERYTPDSLDGHAERLTHLLEQIAADPSAPLHRLEILTREERRRLVHQFNDTAAPIPETTLVAMFEQQVARTPDNIALVFENRELTYAELDAHVNQLAWKLIADGIGPEDIVAICLERSVEMVVAILGILKAGAAYLPLDPGYPAERLAFMIEDAQPRCILTTSGLCASLPDICLLLDAPPTAGFPVSAPTDADRTIPLRPHHPAYVIYTSGSTGRPKGVAVTNLAVCNSINARIHFYDTDIAALEFSAPISFDISVAQIFWTLSRGAKLIVAPVPTGAEAQQCVTHLMMPAAVYASRLAASRGGDLHNLRCVIVGGEALQAETVRLHHEIHEGAELFNEYGLTEATIWSTAIRCDAGPDADPRSIGAPVANTRVYVLDAGLQPCPVGVGRGAVHCGRGPGARLLEPAGADGGAVRRQSFRARARRAALPLGRPRLVARRRQPALPRPRRPADQDPRLPHRAR